MRLNELSDNAGATKNRLQSRSGVSINGFEGGQMPIYMRLPKRGFNKPNRKRWAELSIANVNRAKTSKADKKTAAPKAEKPVAKPKAEKKAPAKKAPAKKAAAPKAAKKSDDAAVSDYLEITQKYDPDADNAIVTKIEKHLGASLKNKDAKYVSCSDETELETIVKGFMKKKMGIDDKEAAMEKVKAVCTTMKPTRMKNRVTFYYLLAKNEGKLGEF